MHVRRRRSSVLGGTVRLTTHGVSCKHAESRVNESLADTVETRSDTGGTVRPRVV